MKELSDYEITEICNKYHIELNHIYCRDELPKHLQNGFYIFNMDKSTGQGTHWIALRVSNNGNYYFDSFGFPPFQELINRIHKYEYNHKIIQDIRSSSCGWFCMLFLWYMQNNGNNKRAFNEFISLFTDKPTTNEKILENFWNRIY